MTATEPITDLSQVRWTARQPERPAFDQTTPVGWHVVGETSDDPDPHVREVYRLHVQYAHDGDCGDCSAWLADMVARKLSESDTGARWQRDRMARKTNEAGYAITQALDLIENVHGFSHEGQRVMIDQAVDLLRPHAREAP